MNKYVKMAAIPLILSAIIASVVLLPPYINKPKYQNCHIIMEDSKIAILICEITKD